jgi:hypothetical protein
MDPKAIGLPEGYYINEVFGTIEKIEDRKALQTLQAQSNTTVMFRETPKDRGLFGHGMASDDAENIFGAVGKVDHDNPNIRWLLILKCPAGSEVFDPTPIAENVMPFLKGDTVQLIRVGRHLHASVIDHEPKEAPRDSFLEGKFIRNVCTVTPPYTPPAVHTHGPCVPPGNLPYFQPNNTPTRGQLSKIIIETLRGAGIPVPEVPEGQRSFQDVPFDNPFYKDIETMLMLGGISGYSCILPAPKGTTE